VAGLDDDDDEIIIIMKVKAIEFSRLQMVEFPQVCSILYFFCANTTPSFCHLVTNIF